MKGYRRVSNIRRTFVRNKIVDHSDVVGAARCSNYIFILDLTPGFIGLGKDNCKTRREAFKFRDLVRPILESLRYIYYICLNVYVFLASNCLHQLGSESVRQLPRWRWISHFSPKRVYQLVGYLFRCILGSNAMFVVYHIRTFTLLKTAVHNEYVNRLS